MQTKYRDYAGLFPNYQALGNQKAQSYQNNANTVGQLLQALSAIAQKNQEMSQGQDLFRGAVGNSTTPQYNVNTDLLGKPMQQQTLGGSQNYIDPVGTRDLIASGNPVAQQMFGNFLKAEQVQRPQWEQFDPTKPRTQVNQLAPEYGKTIDGTPKPMKPMSPRKVGEATEGGRRVATMMNPEDKTTYKVDLGESFESDRLKLAKENIGLARKRLSTSQDDKVKSEGKYYLSKWDDAEKQYNKNALYLTDANLSEATRQRILEEQDGLVQEMIGYTGAIESLGTTVNQVVAPTPKPQPKPSQKPQDGGKIKVKRKSDGKTGTIDAKDFNAEKYDKI